MLAWVTLTDALYQYWFAIFSHVTYFAIVFITEWRHCISLRISNQCKYSCVFLMFPSKRIFMAWIYAFMLTLLTHFDVNVEDSDGGIIWSIHSHDISVKNVGLCSLMPWPVHIVNVTYFNFHKAAFLNEFLGCCKSLYFSPIKEVLYLYIYFMLLNWKTNN